MNQQELRDRFQRVRTRIESACADSGRDPQGVRLVAATKLRAPELLQAALGVGIDVFGENYVQELVEKAESVGDSRARWHFIGHLQRNKVKGLLPHVDRIHSVDSWRLAFEISRRAESLGRNLPVCLEVNIGGEESKGGFEPDQLRAEFAELLELPGLCIDGLMTLPPYRDDPREVRPFFQRLRELRDGLAERFGCPLPELSMGMSADLEAAVAEGATWVRVGTALFGPRPPRD
jgi:pyridoxal phosphate enzyme (YggS family)